MIDVGIGHAIASLIYLVLLLLFITGFVILLKKKNFIGAIVWMSVLFNIFFILFLMGNYRLYPYISYNLINIIWPSINGFLIVIMLVKYLRNKNAKTK